MKGYVDDIEKATKSNDNFRRVLYTAQGMQLVLMALPPGCDIGEEVHPDNDQFFRVDQGEGEVLIDGKTTPISDGFAVVVPRGARHNIINKGKGPLRLYTLYSPPHHKDGIVHKTKEDAEADEEAGADEYEGETTE